MTRWCWNLSAVIVSHDLFGTGSGRSKARPGNPSQCQCDVLLSSVTQGSDLDS
jgi:hypothetical protein